MKKEQVQSAIKNIQTVKVDRLTGILFISGFLLLLLGPILASLVFNFEKNSFEHEFLLASGLIAFFIVEPIALYRMTKKQKQYQLRCEICDSKLLLTDLKLVMVSDKCPYCGEEIIEHI